MVEKNDSLGKGNGKERQDIKPDTDWGQQERNDLSLPDFGFTPPTPSTPPPATGNIIAGNGNKGSQSDDE
jgi:hypothetical protein